MKSEQTKIGILLNEIKDLKSCLREKDKRISRIENKFNLIKKSVLATLSLVTLYPLLWVCSNGRISNIYDTLPLHEQIYCVVGATLIVFGSFCCFIYVIFKILDII